MIRIDAHAEGCVLSVRAQPGAKRNAIVGEHGDALKVAVSAPADQGKANDALVEILARTLKLKGSQIELLSGRASRDKRFLIRGTTASDLQERIGRHANG
ncbi:MAG: DUF167 domain-containing protein [Gemmataceae bacterium]